MPAKKRRLLDSFALLAFLAGEPAGAGVERTLGAAHRAGERILMNEVNIGEVFYVTAKTRSLEAADLFLRRLETLPIEPVGNTFDDVMAAARIKARYPLSYADAFAVATAMKHDAVVLTGDPEFRAANDLVEIEWLAARRR
jgi:predicted nucleic acid-binding protein